MGPEACVPDVTYFALRASVSFSQISTADLVPTLRRVKWENTHCLAHLKCYEVFSYRCDRLDSKDWRRVSGGKELESRKDDLLPT